MINWGLSLTRNSEFVMRNSELLYKLDCIFVGANCVRPLAIYIHLRANAVRPYDVQPIQPSDKL